MCVLVVRLLGTCSVYSRLDCFITPHQSFSDVNIPWAQRFAKCPLQSKLTEGGETRGKGINAWGREKTDDNRRETDGLGKRETLSQNEISWLRSIWRFAEYPVLPVRENLFGLNRMHGVTSGQINPKYSIQYLSSCAVWDIEFFLPETFVSITKTSPWVSVFVCLFWNFKNNYSYLHFYTLHFGHPSYH